MIFHAPVILLLAFANVAAAVTLTDDISIISRLWGQLSPYADNTDNHFSVQDVGLPDGCQIEQVHTLQRHSNRFPTAYYDDGDNDANFGGKIANASSGFTGPLKFLNSWQYVLGSSLLTGLGASAEFQSGVNFWNRYGRLLYNASVAQLAYNASEIDGTPRPKPVLRTTSQSRIENSQINWSLGFFGTSFQTVPDATLANFTSPFDLVIIPEGGTENNTLASYDSCANYNINPIGELGDLNLLNYVELYLRNATIRMQQYAPPGFSFTVNDTYAMQSICAYEMAYIQSSSFCSLFTIDEWNGFENTLDMEYYYDYAWGNPTGRAQGVGYLQELIARLQNQYITVSNSSVNSTVTDNAKDFPLGRPFYADFSHDDIIVSVLTALSLDYFKDPPSLTDYPPNPKRTFVLSHLTPFTARLVTEVIGCSCRDPVAQAKSRTQYYAGQYGYNPGNATHKFIRMRLNNGILPLASIRGGKCEGRSDGLCAMDDFLESQKDAFALSEYQYACFGNYTIADPTDGKDYDGTISPHS